MSPFPSFGREGLGATESPVSQMVNGPSEMLLGCGNAESLSSQADADPHEGKQGGAQP